MLKLVVFFFFILKNQQFLESDGVTNLSSKAMDGMQGHRTLLEMLSL